MQSAPNSTTHNTEIYLTVNVFLECDGKQVIWTYLSFRETKMDESSLAQHQLQLLHQADSAFFQFLAHIGSQRVVLKSYFMTQISLVYNRWTPAEEGQRMDVD